MSLEKFFSPSSVAVIGASREPGKIGYVILENLKYSFNESLYPINPNATEIMGLSAYPSILDVEEPVDLAIIVVPAEIVENTVKECIKKKVKAIVIISSGFSEIGEKEREERLKKLSKENKIRIIGPNCIGIYKKGLDMLFFPRKRIKRPPEGSISFLTQSGAFGSILLDVLAHNGVGVSKFVSVGNKIDVSEIDLFKYLGDDLTTRCIAVYLESVDDGKEFIKIAKKVTKKKPIVVFKAGKTKEGTEAVASHTGSMAGATQVYSAAFKQAGIIEAKNSEELFDYAKALAKQPVAKNNKIAIITDGGGFGIAAADAAIKCGLELPALSSDTAKSLRKFLPSYATIKNPVDLTGDADAERYEKSLKAVLNDKNISGVVVIALMQIPTLNDDIIDVLRDAKMYGKPITVCSVGGEYVIERNRRLERVGIPVFPSPERAVKAMHALYQYAKVLKRKN
jgi:acetyl coenzyme A synthetase (ADP forming)-like protein